jgi:hypothetical protein
MSDLVPARVNADEDGESGGAGLALVLWLIGVPGLVVLLALLFL